MIKIEVTKDADRLVELLDVIQRRKLPDALRIAVARTAQLAKADTRALMPSIFSNPTPYTLNAVYSTPATRDENPTAMVALRPTPSRGGQSAEQYLGPEIRGGPRRFKRFERRASFAEMLPGGQVRAMVPGRGAPLNQYGNVSRGLLTQMLSHLRAYSIMGNNVSAAGLKRARKKGMILARTRFGQSGYFVAKSKRGGGPLGIYRITSPGHVAPVFLFTRNMPAYRPRFDFDGIVKASVARRFPEELETAIAQALSP